MYKKLIILGLFLLSTGSIFCNQEINFQANNPRYSKQEEAIPYENVIAREYNRMRGDLDRYTSMDAIMNQTLRGKSVEGKNQIIADLKSLKQAVHAATAQAEHDGKRRWDWFYIWKDNNASIQALMQHEDDITAKLYQFERDSQSDAVRALRYISGFSLGAVSSIIALYFTQSYLSKENYFKDGKHGMFEMLSAPIMGGLYIASIAAKYALEGLKKSSEGLSTTADYGARALSKMLTETNESSTNQSSDKQSEKTSATTEKK